ncbi:MAG: PAS domain S-box protein [Deltaproteobacteria bacterium]|nr:PAS domain S-box protein [Deltaproteobacteria bacterium]
MTDPSRTKRALRKENLREKKNITDRLTDEMTIIAKIGRIIGASLNINEVYEPFAAEARKLIPFDRLSVSLIHPQSGTVSLAYMNGLDIVGRRPGDSIPVAGSLTEDLSRTRTGFILDTTSFEELIQRYPASANGYKAGMRSLLTVPLISQDEVIGSLGFRSKTPYAYTERDLSLAQRIGDQIAGAIANAQIHDNLKRAEQELAIITKIGCIISSSLNIDEVYEPFAAEASKLIPFDRMAICLHDIDADQLTINYAIGSDISLRKKGDSFRLAGSVSQIVQQRRTGFSITPANVEELAAQFPSLLASYKKGMRSIIIAPLISRDIVIGDINFRSTKTKAYTERHIRLAERIGDQIAGVIANAQLFDKLKKTESSLRESETRFRAIFDQAAVGVAEVELSTGRYLNVNRRLCEILGMTQEEILATTFLAVTYPEDRHSHDDQLALMVAGKIEALTLEKRFVRKDGTVIWVKVTASPLWKPGEKPERDISIIEDITEHKQADEALKSNLDQLESRVRKRTIELEEINTALRVLLKKGEMDQKKVAESIQGNINELVMPFLHRLKKNQSKTENVAYLNILETNLNQIASPFISQLSATYRNLTPKEIQIAELIKQGKSSKEIAECFGLSVGTVTTHRNNIRKKMRLNSKSANLRSHLLFLS